VDTMEVLQEIFRDVFDEEDMEIYADMSAGDHEEWDSLTQIQIVVATEKKFSIRFTTAEVMGLKNVGEFAALIDTKRDRKDNYE